MNQNYLSIIWEIELFEFPPMLQQSKQGIFTNKQEIIQLPCNFFVISVFQFVRTNSSRVRIFKSSPRSPPYSPNWQYFSPKAPNASTPHCPCSLGSKLEDALLTYHLFLCKEPWECRQLFFFFFFSVPIWSVGTFYSQPQHLLVQCGLWKWQFTCCSFASQGTQYDEMMNQFLKSNLTWGGKQAVAVTYYISFCPVKCSPVHNRIVDILQLTNTVNKFPPLINL